MVNKNNDDVIRILICGDPISFKHKTRFLAKQAREMEVVAETQNIEDMVQKTRELSPDCIVVFMHHSNIGWLHAIKMIKSENSSIKFLILSDRNHILIKAVKEGYCGYTIKNMDSIKFANLVKRVKKNEIVLPGVLLKRIMYEYERIANIREITTKKGIKLTKREEDILHFLVHGKRTNDIAQSLIITEKTVRLHIGKILKKLHCNTRQEAVVCAIQQGYLKENMVVLQ